jgi:anthranilate synthase component 1
MIHHRSIAWPAGSPTGHDIFRHVPHAFRALLEDPSGSGRQFLVSAEGQARALHALADGEAFLAAWRRELAGPGAEVPGVRCLFYAAYEAGALCERLPEPKTPLAGPLIWTHMPAWSLCIDGDRLHLTTLKGEAHLHALARMLPAVVRTQGEAPAVPVAQVRATGREAYLQAVARAKAYIHAGDVFQVNLARFWRAQLAEAGLPDLYARLRQVNPAPFSAFLRIGDDDPFYVASASPERLFRLHADGGMDTRPIAGTRRRGDGEGDVKLASELLLSEKERAEHIMLVDLERNDLGRVCRPGSVAVDECMVLERYATVQHIVSNVRGRLAPGLDIVDVFRAMFPGGTITGCPKLRCMQIIHELEGQARGAYTGGIGHVGWDGHADMNILIRSFWWRQGELAWAAGAGIVADSDAEAECQETGDKAAGLLRALAPMDVRGVTGHDPEMTKEMA